MLTVKVVLEGDKEGELDGGLVGELEGIFEGEEEGANGRCYRRSDRWGIRR